MRTTQSAVEHICCHTPSAGNSTRTYWPQCCVRLCNMLLRRLCNKFGICGSALDWIASFLHGRVQPVFYRGRLLYKLELLFDVPQGSVLGSISFTELFNVISACGFVAHEYADDTQVYISTPASDHWHDEMPEWLYHSDLRPDGQQSTEAQRGQDAGYLAGNTLAVK